MSNKIALEALTDAKRAINSMKVEAETAGAGGDQEMLQDACEQISNEGLAADTAIRAAIAALEAMEAGGWLPIASAPKDGRAVLLYGAWAGEITGVTDIRGIEIGYWSDGESDFPGDDWWRLSGGDAYSCWIRPTHWMPLPTPPKD